MSEQAFIEIKLKRKKFPSDVFLETTAQHEAEPPSRAQVQLRGLRAENIGYRLL